MSVRTYALAIVLMGFLAGCRNDPLRVDTIQLGRSLNADNSVGSHTMVFKPEDTVYVSILTAGAGSGTLGVRWSYGGRVIDEPSKPVSYKGAAATEFHIQSGSGFPPGEYKVEVLVDGTPAGSRNFRVE